MNKAVKNFGKMAVLLGTVLILASCLTTEVDIDLRKHDDLRLSLVYRMPLSLWQFGVFDEGSQERAVPVSRRDAEETAILHPQVILETYTLDESDDEAIITVVYRSETVEGLQALWGNVAGEALELSFEERRILLPLTEGLGETVADPQQQELINQVFQGRYFNVTFHLPDDIESVNYPDIPSGEVLTTSGDREAAWQAPMSDVLTATAGQVISVNW